MIALKIEKEHRKTPSAPVAPFQLKEINMFMRTLSRALILTVGLLFIGALASSVCADNLPVGTFTLAHPTQWNGTTLPAGEYHFKLTRTQTDTNMLVITGEKQTLHVMVFAQSACTTCKNEALRMKVQGDKRIVTSFDVPGYHLDFKAPRTESANADVTDSWIELVSVQVDGTN
jgi:hypothetical protein